MDNYCPKDFSAYETQVSVVIKTIYCFGAAKSESKTKSYNRKKLFICNNKGKQTKKSYQIFNLKDKDEINSIKLAIAADTATFITYGTTRCGLCMTEKFLFQKMTPKL